MRITNGMIRNNVLWGINKNEQLMSNYEMQLSTGKKILKPSDNPIIAVRSLKFRTNVREISQYKTNSEDASSWLSVNEQAMQNTFDLMNRSRELCVQAASDVFATGEREKIIAELEQLKTQFLNEGNVNYAGRFVFSGFKTDKPLVFTEDNSDTYEITEHFNVDDMDTTKKVIGNDVREIHRIRLGYSGTSQPAAPTVIPDFTVNAVNASDPLAYEPAVDTINFIQDTGELIFHSDNVNGIGAAKPIPDPIDFMYEKAGFIKGDIVPEQYFDCNNITSGEAFTWSRDKIKYQISYNQDIIVNTMGSDFITKDLVRDYEELINVVKNIKDDGSVEQSLQEDVLGDFFGHMISNLDGHINNITRKESEVGSKMNRLSLTINRLADDNINFTELLSKNEDVDMHEAVLKLQAQETVYNAALMSSGKIMQQTLLDFMR